MNTQILLLAIIGLGVAAGTHHIHDKIDHIIGAKAALLHKVHGVKAKKIEIVKDVSKKALETVKAVKEKKVELVHKLLHKKKVVHAPEINVAYKVHKYHGVKVTPVIHTVQPHIQVQHVPVPVYSSYHSEEPHPHSYQTVHAQHPVIAHVEPSHVSYSHEVAATPYSEWKQPEWVPSHVSDQFVVTPKKKLISKLKEIHAVKQSWLPSLSVSHDAAVVHESHSASYPSHTSGTSGNYWQESAVPSGQWASSEHVGPHHSSSFQFSVNHPGHSTSHQSIHRSDYPSQPIPTYSEEQYESPYNRKPLRNSYGEIISGDIGYSASENAAVAVAAPKSGQQDDDLESTVEEKQPLHVEIPHDHSLQEEKAEKVEVTTPNNATTTA